MKRSFLFVLLSGLAFAASAQSAQPVSATPEPAPQAAPAGQDATDQNASSDKAALSDRDCLRHTGSRLIRRDAKGDGCANATGRAYTREELDRTGGRDLAQSLRLLDPAIH